MADIGELRRSAAAHMFGPGAIVDFRDDEALISGVAAGLEEWDRSFPPAGLANPQQTREVRLERLLGVDGFRLPPVKVKDTDRGRLVAVRFPRWQQCPECDVIAPFDNNIWGQEIGRAGLYCTQCSRQRRKVWAVPVRFVMACPRGHLDDFPWHQWVGHRKDCQNLSGPLRIKMKAAGLAGLYVHCDKCKESSNLDGIFSERTWTNRRCNGRRPWLPSADEQGCPAEPRAVQRGATNIYYPITASALSIPPWSDGLVEALGVFWAPIRNMPNSDHRRDFILHSSGALSETLNILGITADELVDRIEARLQLLESEDSSDLRVAEYRHLLVGSDTEGDFECRLESLPDALRPWFGSLSRVVRLREVRALTGFTRIRPQGDADATVAALSVNRLRWLPAVEVRGEGVFLSLNMDALRSWEKNEFVTQRGRVLAERSGGGQQPAPSTRYILVHTLAHAVMRQLTLDCGYSSASLRERLYVSDGGTEMAGFLVYTASTDADGTLGGLERQGRSNRMASIVRSAIKAIEWCSSDPLCIEDVMAASDTFSGASCHACAMAPETSCEVFNYSLDRALLIGHPDHPGLGYFEGLVRNR